MKIRNHILIQTLSASLALILVLGAAFFLSVAGIRNTVLANSNDLGNSAADIGSYALEEQLTGKIERIAQDMALILDERLKKIESHTRMTADITESIYANKQGWNPKSLPRVRSGDVSSADPYLYLAPGVDFSRISGEVYLAGNISDILRQIKVVDPGITTSVIAGESGYSIMMDVFPWPVSDFDSRTFSWYQEAKERESLYWTDVYNDSRGRGLIISCAVPFYEQAGTSRVIRGVARSTVLLSDFSRITDTAGMGRTGELFLLNREGIKIFSSNGIKVQPGGGGGVEGENFLESQNPHLRSLGMSMTLGASGMTGLEMDGLLNYVAYAPIQTLGWSLGVAVPFQELSFSAQLIENQIWKVTDDTKAVMNRYIALLGGLIALLLFFTILGIAVFAVRFTHAVTGPILALNDGVHEVAAGNLEREVIVKTGDEIEQLAVSFNMMTSRLRRHIEEIARATAEKQRMDTELDIATQIQMSILPNVFPPFPGRKNEFDLYAEVHPAREVGGDFYDFFFVDNNHFAMVIADVSGKGIPAALFMAMTKTLIKNRLQSGEDPALALEIINRQLCDNNITDMFVTVWLCVLEISSGRLVYVNAGHNPPLLRRKNQSFTFLVSPPDLILAGMNDTRYHPGEMRLNPGDTLFLYTDGVVEAESALMFTDDAFYGKERLRNFLNAHAARPLNEMLPLLRADIAVFAGGANDGSASRAAQSDDITMLAVRINRNEKNSSPGAVTLKADIAELDTLTAFIGSEFDASGCPRQVRDQIEHAVEEIFVNIARYAYDEVGGEVTVECCTESLPEGMTMTLLFSDRGRAFNPLEHKDPDISLPLEEREPGGLGLLIVRKTMDTIQYNREDGTNRLTLGKSWNKEGE
ncbi:MAG: SpoIIE family protein phosphatase [Treponema sp.]|jgi:sigma-B regulation protein RsbU (phosphoserine phosphatase)|nr:SpoIIE family protein phosphatase [Treponema sp.]